MNYRHRIPKYADQTGSIAASSTDTVEIAVPAGDEEWLIKSIEISPGANTTIDSIVVDGIDLNLTAGSNDMETQFGSLIRCANKVVVTASNSNTSAEDTTVTIRGIKKDL